MLVSTHHRFLSCCTLLAAMTSALMLPAASVNAGIITAWDWHSGVASVGLEPVTIPPESQWNQDFVGLSPNSLVIPQKAYMAIGPVDLTFTVINSGGSTEYALHEGVWNGTGVDWIGYRFILGYGIGDDFIEATSGGLHFDNGPLHNSPFNVPFFSTLDVQMYSVTASGGVVPAATYMPGLLAHFHVPDGITEFTIRQMPIGIPAPGAAITLLAGLCMSRRRRR